MKRRISMENQFRLKSSTMFERVEEDSPESPYRVIILSVEGNKTEQDYFKHVEKYRTQLGIKSCVHVHPLKRAKHDNKSAPQEVLELLEEYIELRNSEILPTGMREVIPEIYTDEFIQKYLKDSDKIDTKEKREFEIDTHSVEQLQSIVKKCKENNYYCFITNPLIEFWLLMHVMDVKKQYPDNLDDFLINKVCSSKHTYTSKKLSEIVQHGKSINDKKRKAWF